MAASLDLIRETLRGLPFPQDNGRTLEVFSRAVFLVLNNPVDFAQAVVWLDQHYSAEAYLKQEQNRRRQRIASLAKQEVKLGRQEQKNHPQPTIQADALIRLQAACADAAMDWEKDYTGKSVQRSGVARRIVLLAYLGVWEETRDDLGEFGRMPLGKEPLKLTVGKGDPKGLGPGNHPCDEDGRVHTFFQWWSFAGPKFGPPIEVAAIKKAVKRVEAERENQKPGPPDTPDGGRLMSPSTQPGHLAVPPAPAKADTLSSTPAGGDYDALPNEDKALGVLAKHPGWTNKKIAQALGVHPKTLSRWPRFKAARQAQKEMGRAKYRNIKHNRETR